MSNSAAGRPCGQIACLPACLQSIEAMAATPAQHYDSLAVPSLAERATGQTYLLKQLHNSFKRTLIEKHARGADLLVDVACGRGNDLHKWAAAGIKRVVGVDVSGAQIAEARRRAKNAQHIGTRATFCVSSPDLAALDELKGRTADAVTCMFALNYFWETDEHASGLFQHVRRVLKPGGTFFGVCADGARVVEFLNPHAAAESPPLETDAYELVPLWRGFPAAFGSSYTLRIADTVLDNNSALAPEHLVYWPVLRDVARAHGFEPLQEEFEHVDSSSLPSQALRDISRINASFAFRLGESVEVGGPSSGLGSGLSE